MDLSSTKSIVNFIVKLSQFVCAILQRTPIPTDIITKKSKIFYHVHTLYVSNSGPITYTITYTIAENARFTMYIHCMYSVCIKLRIHYIHQYIHHSRKYQISPCTYTVCIKLGPITKQCIFVYTVHTVYIHNPKFFFGQVRS